MSSKKAIPHRWAWQEAVWEEPWQLAPPRYTVVPTVPTSLLSPLTCGTTYERTQEKSRSHVPIVPTKQQLKATSLSTFVFIRGTNPSPALIVPIIVQKNFTWTTICLLIVIGISQLSNSFVCLMSFSLPHVQCCKTISYCRGKCGVHIVKVKLEAYFKAEIASVLISVTLALEPIVGNNPITWDTEPVWHWVTSAYVTLGYLSLPFPVQ